MHRQSRFALLSLAAALVVVSGTAATAPVTDTTSAPTSAISSSSLGSYSPTFVGPAATGCDISGCSLLTGPFFSPSVAGPNALTASALSPHSPKVMPLPTLPRRSAPGPKSLVVSVPPTVSCQPRGPGCDLISSSSGGAKGVKGLNAVDSGIWTGGDIEPADQGLCAGNGYVVEANNLGEVLVFNTALQRKSSVIPLDIIMGLTSIGWSSAGDVSCLYDYSNGGHWFFTEIVSSNSEGSGGAFTGCFAGVANACYEGIAVSVGSDPFGPYNVYFLSADYTPAEPGFPYLLNDFAKIAVTRDAFLLFYDEFPLSGSAPGLGGGFFNGSQEFAFDKKALELGLPTQINGSPNPLFNVAIENMGLLATPDGTCFSDNTHHLPGFTCWYQDIPAMPPDPTQYDNSHGGSGFILGSLDFYGQADTRIAVFDWKGLSNLSSPFCKYSGGIQFWGQ